MVSATQLSVAGPESPVLTEVVASLPVSFAFAQDSAPDVRIVSGDGDWVARAREALAERARGIIVTDPSIVPVESVRALARDAIIPVVLSEAWAGNPAVTEVRARWGESIRAAMSVECTVTEPLDGEERQALLLRQARVLRGLGVRGVVLSGGSVSTRAYSLVGESSTGQQVSLFAVTSSGAPTALTVSLMGDGSSVRVSVPAATSARPAHASRLTPGSGEVLPTIWETAHRAAFRRMHDLIVTKKPSDDLEGFASDLELVGRWRGSDQPGRGVATG